MRKYLFVIAIIITFINLNYLYANSLKNRCKAPLADEEFVYGDDFSWHLSFNQMKDLFDKTYNSGKRLKGRFYFDPTENQIVAPLSYSEERSVVSVRFIKSITEHIEKALKLTYADFIFFPDMGHNHFFIPNNIWDKYLSIIDNKKTLYEKLFDEPQLRMLYHTAEQLQMLKRDTRELLDNRYTQKRYYTRNIIGSNNHDGVLDMVFSPIADFNTVRDFDDHKYYSSGVNISASKDGCFSYEYKGRTYFYDISLYDLPYQDLGDSPF